MVSVPDKHKQMIGKFRPILWVSANVGALFERSEFVETFANRRRIKMGKIDVSVVLGWHGHRLQIVALNCAIWQVLKKIQAFDPLILIGNWNSSFVFLPNRWHCCREWTGIVLGNITEIKENVPQLWKHYLERYFRA